jgi:DNA-binding transcriptional ArsR family regulator
VARKRTAASEPPPLADEALELVAARFRALGDPTRLSILNRLMRGELSVGELVEQTGLEQPNVSRHLAVLRREGVVARRAEGNRGYYRIDDPTVVRLCEVVCGGLIERLSGDLEGLSGARAWMGMNI